MEDFLQYIEPSRMKTYRDIMKCDNGAIIRFSNEENFYKQIAIFDILGMRKVNTSDKSFPQDVVCYAIVTEVLPEHEDLLEEGKIHVIIPIRDM